MTALLLAALISPKLTEFQKGVYTGQCSKICITDNNSDGGYWMEKGDDCICWFKVKRKEGIGTYKFPIGIHPIGPSSSGETHGYDEFRDTTGQKWLDFKGYGELLR